MTEESSSSRGSLPVGTRVYLKTTTIGESLGIKPYRKNGGEAVVTSVITEGSGAVYYVRLLNNGKCRAVRRDSLTVHRVQTQPVRASRRTRRQ